MMTDAQFADEIYNGLNMMMRGIGAIMAAIAKRYALGCGRVAANVDTPEK